MRRGSSRHHATHSWYSSTTRCLCVSYTTDGNSITSWLGMRRFASHVASKSSTTRYRNAQRFTPPAALAPGVPLAAPVPAPPPAPAPAAAPARRGTGAGARAAPCRPTCCTIPPPLPRRRRVLLGTDGAAAPAPAQGGAALAPAVVAGAGAGAPAATAAGGVGGTGAPAAGSPEPGNGMSRRRWRS